MEDADDIAKRIASRAKNAIEEGSWGYYKNFGTWNYEGTVYIRTVRPLLRVFFSESAIRFSNLQISKKDIQKNYPEKITLSEKNTFTLYIWSI